MVAAKPENHPQVFMVGALPPTVGGISIHIERLSRMLHRAGFKVRVYDIYTTGGGNHKFPFEVVCKSGLPLVIAFFWALWRQRPAVVHWHLSAGDHLWQLFPLLLASPPQTRHVFTAHSGWFAKNMRALPAWRLWFSKLVLARATHVVCVNRDLEAYLKAAIPALIGRTSVIIPYLAPPDAPPQRPSPPAGIRRKLLASGYGLPLYDWMTYVAACQRASDCVEVAHLVFYNQPDPAYKASVLARAAETPGLFKVSDDLSPAQFAELLAVTDVFVRPTQTDGDSIALREALARGIVCLTSDAVARPDGCHLFPVGDSAALAKKIKETYEGKCQGAPAASGDGSVALLELYNRLTGKMSAAATKR